MQLELLFQNPAKFFDMAIYRVAAVVIALVFHEWAHGYVAYRMGDPTAKEMGRLTLNPLKHMDPMGTLMMFLLGFGWAKPVPVDPRYFKHPHRDDFFVSIAGITMNLIIFLLCMVVGTVLAYQLYIPEVFQILSLKEVIGFYYELMHDIFQGEGAKYAELFARPGFLPAVRLVMQVGLVNLSIAIFNLIPIPPLDGSHVLNDLILRKDNLFVSKRIAQFGMVAVLLLSFTGLLGKVMGEATHYVQMGVLWVIGLVTGG